VLQGWYRDVTRVLQVCYRCVTRVLQGVVNVALDTSLRSHDAMPIQGCYRNVTGLSQGCYLLQNLSFE
jgi:hypothetical protein